MLNKIKKLLGMSPAIDMDKGVIDPGNPGTVHLHLGASGRVPIEILQEAAKKLDEEGFLFFLGAPVLMGSGISEGEMVNQREEGRVRKATLHFKPAEMMQAIQESPSLRRAVYPLIARDQFTLDESGGLSVGRVQGNALVVPDFAVSREHAIISRTGSTYYLEDLGSTNGTLLSGNRISRERKKIQPNDTIQFGRYEFRFRLADSVYQLLRSPTLTIEEE
jgi:hypothetical protein